MILVVEHMSGAGNAFVVIDNRDLILTSSEIQRLVPALCNRIGISLPPAEGVLVLTGAGIGSAASTFYNPDGSTGAMCGNGGRCLVRFALDHGSTLDGNGAINFTMAGTLYSARVTSDGTICVDFPPPIEIYDLAVNELVELPGGGTYVNVGSDHVVIDTNTLEHTDSLWDMPLRDIALPIRHARRFPRGTNVNLAMVISRDKVEMRTFERGVEDETGACGTGAISTALALWRHGLVDDNVSLTPTSMKSLQVRIQHREDVIQSITLCGDAVYDAASIPFDTSTGSYL